MFSYFIHLTQLVSEVLSADHFWSAKFSIFVRKKNQTNNSYRKIEKKLSTEI